MTPSKRLLFVNQHYWPDFASTGQHLTDLAEYLADSGYNVTVLCSRGRYLAGTLRAPRREVRNGVEIYRLPATAFGRATHAGRLLDYASFYVQVLLRLLLFRRFDYVITLTTPPLLCVAATVARAVTRQRYGIWSMDLHPDAEEALGMIQPGGAVTRLLHRLNNISYRRADFVVDLGPYMKARIRKKGVASSRLHTIPVWNKRDEICPVPRKENALADRLGLQDKFVVMYSGNAGLAHRFDEVLGAMQMLHRHPKLFFLFVGSGPRRAEIEAFISENDISNARYLDYFPREELKYSLSLADVHLLTLRDDMAGIAAPGKLYGIMAAGRPVVMVGPRHSEPANTIVQEKAGIVIDPNPLQEDAAEYLAGRLLDLYEHPGRCRELGRNGRTAFLNKYEQVVCCMAWDELLKQLGESPFSVINHSRHYAA